MSIIKQEKIQFGTLSGVGYGETPVFTATVEASCRFYDKKAVNFSGDDEFINFDSIANVKGYKPENDEIAIYNGVKYRVVDVQSLQGRIQKSKYQVKLLLYNV